MSIALRLFLATNMAFGALGILALCAGAEILAAEVLREGHRSTNAVTIGLVLACHGLSAVHRTLSDLFGKGARA